MVRLIRSTSGRGRPKAVYHVKLGGDPVVGLMRLGDGRWRASGPERFTMTRTLGRAPRGQRVVTKVPAGHWRVVTR